MANEGKNWSDYTTDTAANAVVRGRFRVDEGFSGACHGTRIAEEHGVPGVGVGDWLCVFTHIFSMFTQLAGLSGLLVGPIAKRFSSVPL